MVGAAATGDPHDHETRLLKVLDRPLGGDPCHHIGRPCARYTSTQRQCGDDFISRSRARRRHFGHPSMVVVALELIKNMRRFERIAPAVRRACKRRPEVFRAAHIIAVRICVMTYRPLSRMISRNRAYCFQHDNQWGRCAARHLRGQIWAAWVVAVTDTAVCIPQSVTLGQVMHVTVLYLDQHPARLDAPFLALAHWT